MKTKTYFAFRVDIFEEGERSIVSYSAFCAWRLS